MLCCCGEDDNTVSCVYLVCCCLVPSSPRVGVQIQTGRLCASAEPRIQRSVGGRTTVRRVWPSKRVHGRRFCYDTTTTRTSKQSNSITRHAHPHQLPSFIDQHNSSLVLGSYHQACLCHNHDHWDTVALEAFGNCHYDGFCVGSGVCDLSLPNGSGRPPDGPCLFVLYPRRLAVSMG